MIDSAADLNPEWVRDKRVIGVTAGASAPEVLVQEVIRRLKDLGAGEVQELSGAVETIVFPLPKSLAAAPGRGEPG